MRFWQIGSLEAAYLSGEIGCGVSARAKRALQTLSRHYWRGGRLSSKDINRTENAILGALSSGLYDEKVWRWALSAISRIGREQVCWTAVKNAMILYPDQPQVVSAAIAALFKMNPDQALPLLSANNALTPQVLTLSALQTVDQKKVVLPAIEINIEKADAAVLKLALVLVGLDRCPDGILHPRFPNREIVKALGKHHEPLVSQYSAWATAENPHLSAQDLGIDVRYMDDLPENVRGYIYRLYAAEGTYSDIQHEIIQQSSQDPSTEARLGGAIGLRDTYYDGLDEVASEWYLQEEDDDVRSYVLDHIVRQSEKSLAYHRLAKDVFSSKEDGFSTRQRMEVAAAGTSLYKEFKLIQHQEDEGLFSEGRFVVNNTFNNFGNIQGQVSQSGDSKIDGDQTNQSILGKRDKIRGLLADSKNALLELPIAAPLKIELKDSISLLEEKPDSDNVGRLVKILQQAQKGVAAVAGTAEAAAKLAGIIASLSVFMS